jgi:hypothetical protein
MMCGVTVYESPTPFERCWDFLYAKDWRIPTLARGSVFAPRVRRRIEPSCLFVVPILVITT